MASHLFKDGKPRDIGVSDHKTAFITSQTEAPLTFFRLVEVTLADLNAGSKAVLAAADIPTGKSAWIKYAELAFSSTAFSGATNIKLQDTGGNDIMTVTIATTTGNKVLPDSAYPTGMTVQIAHDRRVSQGLGINVLKTGSAAADGDTFYVIVEGEFVDLVD